MWLFDKCQFFLVAVIINCIPSLKTTSYTSTITLLFFLNHAVLMSIPICVYQWIAGVYTRPAHPSQCHDGKWNGLSSWKNECCVNSLKWCNTGSLESHSVLGSRTVCVISAQPVGWRAISQALWINLWQDLLRIKQNCMFNLTCPRAESSLVINQDREDCVWPTLG